MKFLLKSCSCLMTYQDIIEYEQHRFQTEEKPSATYSIYRVVHFATFVTVAIISIININQVDHDHDPEHDGGWKWLIYTTNWTFLFCTLYSCVAMAVVLKVARRRNSDRQSKNIPILYKAYHILYILAVVNSFVVTILYWSIIHKSTSNILRALDVLIHGGNFLAMAVDFILLRLPWRMGHMLYPILSGLAYAIFSFTYYQLGGVDRYGNPFIYDILDWRKPYKTFAFSLLCLITQIIATCIFIIFYNLIETFIKSSKIQKELTENILVDQL